jgi:hypothetical protein
MFSYPIECFPWKIKNCVVVTVKNENYLFLRMTVGHDDMIGQKRIKDGHQSIFISKYGIK